MLNRLMFCYFLQQKGFLNGEQDYLGKRLATVKETLGENQFHSFYRSFLKRLFHEGFDGEERPPELTALIGKNIPYLNGGIFAEHPIERAHPDIQIPDDAFEKIFQFFGEWEWHLDARPLGKDGEINPEVLGYVFEKYTNQKEMGAYYTKEDITEYISKNTILPYLLQQIAAKVPAHLWDLLKNDPDNYIYEPVRRGVPPLRQEDGSMIEPDEAEQRWLSTLPDKIARGIDTEAPDLLERRKDWNTSTAASHALPTEIWRETISRHQRCHELRKKLRAGEVNDPAYLVTLNLNIRQFVQDLIAAAPADLALALWKTLRSLSVLDPTCGSGAFLFAALEILEPLYEGLLERLRALLADWQSSGEKHPNWEKEITKILESVERHPNEDYFIHKTIIIHNLYGVDIMEEAVEICKLRLFLKLAAQLEPGQTIEPLPDIDFNVRTGNTLVGYASREEIKRAFTEAGGSGQTLLQGIENSLEDYHYSLREYRTLDCGNIYAQCAERIARLVTKYGFIGIIVPLSGFFTGRMRPYHDLLVSQFSKIHVFHLSGDAHPSMLFEGVKYRLCTILGKRGRESSEILCTAYTRWYAAERNHLFQTKVSYCAVPQNVLRSRFLKLGCRSALAIYERLKDLPQKVGLLLRNRGEHMLNYHRSPVFWIRSMDFEPYFKSQVKERSTEHLKDIFVSSASEKFFVGTLINSTLFYFWSTISGNCRNLTGEDISEMPIALASFDNEPMFKTAFRNLMDDLKRNSKRRVYTYKSGEVEYEEFYPSKSKSLVDAIDILLAQSFSFSEVELDYIISYDIKYRMGLSGGGNKEEEEEEE